MPLERMLLCLELGRFHRQAPYGCGGQAGMWLASRCAGCKGNGMTAYKRTRALSIGLALAATLLFAAQSNATTAYPDYVGPNIGFTGIQETSTFGDPEPLFGAPIGLGNQLLFFPANFSASSAGGAGVDQTGSQLQAQISAVGPLDTIDTINITEFGDAVLTGIGTAATGTFASMAGFITVLEDISGPITPVQIPFVGVFSPSDLLTLPGDAGTTLWSATVSIDVASVVPNATVAFLSYDNNLVASSEAGTSSLIQKKVVDGPAVIVDVIPEPGTAVLVGSGLILLGIRSRRNSA